MSERTAARLAAELGPVSPDDVTVQRMFYTSCPLCGALNDWSDTRAAANRNRRAHIKAHMAPASDHQHAETSGTDYMVCYQCRAGRHALCIGGTCTCTCAGS